MYKLLILLALCSSTQAADRFIKISNSGKQLPPSAVIGSNANDWACTYDSATRSLWEVKTNDKGLRDMNWTYLWYNGSDPVNKGTKTTDDLTLSCFSSIKSSCNTEQFVNDVNANGLCGVSNWSMPTRDELLTLRDCPQGNQDWRFQNACINNMNDQPGEPNVQMVTATDPINYFVNTLPAIQSSTNHFRYWTSETDPLNVRYAIEVNFGHGGYTGYEKKFAHHVRLIRRSYTLKPIVEEASMLPTWDSQNAILNIPKFDSTSPIKSAKVKFDFNSEKFIVLDVQ